MTDEEDQRRQWRLTWLTAIQAFSDGETQNSRWLDPAELNPAHSFVECMCSYFDDARLREKSAYERKLTSGHVCVEEVAAVADFHVLAGRYKSPSGDDYDHEAILRDEKWLKVVDAAERSRQRLLSLITDAVELTTLTRPLYWEERGGAFYADLIGTRIMPTSKWVAEHEGKPLPSILDWLRRKLFGSPAS